MANGSRSCHKCLALVSCAINRATMHLTILLEQKAFLERVFKIPFEERSWKRLLNLDTIHSFYGGPVPSKEAQRLDRFSRVQSKVDNLKKFKDSSRALGQEANDLKAKLSEMAHQTDDLVKQNANLKSEVAVLHEHMEKVKEKAIKEYQVSQPYFDEMGGYYGDKFEDFHKQAILMFPDLDFSLTQIKLIAPTTPVTKLTPNNVKTDERCW
ncbi:hypothetical protein SO802_028820 [Lithocarpus litseifolius]|uniref:Uncharacterized protein n=1 Tax=Lithocarpus litseifolius TaxID=425828 RepID=A0AAW2BRS3_9ROSI